MRDKILPQHEQTGNESYEQWDLQSQLSSLRGLLCLPFRARRIILTALPLAKSPANLWLFSSCKVLSAEQNKRRGE
jgi:hypothetical protein